ncbi:hypothetical protein TGRUB_264210 [Toxoplasma gondii RUB]|uniref:Uncharacterized protein n=1 Tax=Toxoplasma gondii RUB TaxID=935652 RepID=A0A086LKN2_TOXGO|nr:hypothetical protein TGRUB_264210 [Toxoplasma gondii RUB]
MSMEGDRPSGASPDRVAEPGSRQRRLRQPACVDSPSASSATSSVPQPKRERRRRERLPQTRSEAPDSVDLPLPTRSLALVASQDTAAPPLVSPQAVASRRAPQPSSAGPSSVSSSRKRSLSGTENRGKEGDHGEEKTLSIRKRKPLSELALKDSEDPAAARVTPARCPAVGALQRRRKVARRSDRVEMSALRRGRCRRGGLASEHGEGGRAEQQDRTEEEGREDGDKEGDNVEGQESRKRCSGDEGGNTAGEKADDGEDGSPVSSPSSDVPSLLSVPRVTGKESEAVSFSASPCSTGGERMGGRGGREGRGDGPLEQHAARDRELAREDGSSSRARNTRRRKRGETEEEGHDGDTEGLGPPESLEELQSERRTRSMSRRGGRKKRLHETPPEKGRESQGEGDSKAEAKESPQTANALPLACKRGRRGASEGVAAETEGGRGTTEEPVEQETADAASALPASLTLPGMRGSSSSSCQLSSFRQTPSLLPSSCSRPNASSCFFSSDEPFCSPCAGSPVSLYNSPLAGHAPSPTGPPSLGFPSPRALNGDASRRSKGRSVPSVCSQCTPQTSYRRGERSRGPERGSQVAGAYDSPRTLPNDGTGYVPGSRGARPLASRKESLRRHRSPSVYQRKANTSLSRRESESSVLSGSALLSAAAAASSLHQLPPPASPFKGSPRPGVAERKRRKRQRQDDALGAVGPKSEGGEEAEERDANVAAPGEEAAQGSGEADDSDDLGSPCLPYSREEEEEKALFPHPRRQAMKHACSSARSSLSRLSSSSWRGAFSPSAIIGPPDVWGASPCASDSAFFDAGRVSASFSLFPSSPCSASVLWSGPSPTLLGAGSGSYFGPSNSLDSSTSSQVSTSSASSSVVFARPVLVRRGDREDDGNSDGERVPSRNLRKRGRQRHASPSTRASSGGCVFRPPRRVAGVASAFTPQEAGAAAGSGAVTSLGATGLTTPCPRHFPLLPSLSRSGFLLTGTAMQGASNTSAALTSQTASAAGPRNPLSSDNMLLAASWGVSFHRANARACGTIAGSLMGSAASGAAGSAIPQSSPLVRRARRLSEGDARDTGEEDTAGIAGGDRRDREGGVTAKHVDPEEGDGEGQRDGRRSGEAAEPKRKVGGGGKKEWKKGVRADTREKKAANASVSPKGAREKGRTPTGGRAAGPREMPSTGKENVASWAGVEA